MSALLGLPFALFLILAGVVALIAAAIVHWLLVIVGVVALAVGVYVLLTGGLGPL